VPKQRPVAHRTKLAGVLAVILAAAAVVMSLSFAKDSSAAEAGTGTQRVSVGTSGVQGGFDSNEPAMSADGRFVAFTTDEPFDPLDKLAVSQGEGGGDPETTQDADVYVRDTQLGTTTLISHGAVFDEVGHESIVPSDGESTQPTISGDGRFVAFRTTAINIAGGNDGSVIDSSGSAIVVCDRDPDGDGVFNPTCQFTTVSISDDDEPLNPHISADGRRISYDVTPFTIGLLARRAARAAAADVTEPDGRTGWVELVELRRDATGVLVPPVFGDRTFITASATETIGGASEDLDSQGDSTMAAGGLHIAFVAHYSQSESAEASVVLDYDVNTGGLTRLDLDASGAKIAADGREFRSPALSGDGRRYAFTDVQAFNKIGVRLYDRDPDGDGTFGQPSVVIASRATDGTEGLADQPAFSADGRYLAFTTPSPGMHTGTDVATRPSSCLGRGANLSFCDVVVRDVVVDAAREAAGLPRLPAELASPSAACLTAAKPCEGTGQSGLPTPTGDGSRDVSSDGSPVLSTDGSVIAYGSAAPDLIDGGADTNGHLDVFRRRFTPALAADPQDFGPVPLGSEAIKNVVVTDVGAGPLHVTSVSVDPGDFAVFPGEACTTVVLHASETCVVSIRFQPTVLGARTGVLRVAFDGGASPLSVALTGTGTQPPVGAFAAGPAALDFGARLVLQTSPVKSVTVRNTGTGPLQLRAVALNITTFRGDYLLSAGACANRSLPVGGTCRIDVRHRPTAVGVRPAVLTVNYVGPAGEALTFPVTLTGSGTAPTLTSSPTVTPAGRVIQITGTGFPPNSTSKLSLTGMPGTTTAKARADGTFLVPFVVLPNTWTGKHPLTADVLPATAPGLSTPLQATLEFVIVPGSPVPPDFDTRK